MSSFDIMASHHGMDTNLTTTFTKLSSEAELKQLITDKVREGLYLEFKQKQDARHGTLEDRDKKNFSKAIAGFANSDGGILIWGIRTRAKDEAAVQLKPINQVDDFIKSLKSFLMYAAQPVVDDILIERISKEKSKSKGYVKCLIPASYKAPHRAIDREYYKRSVEGFYRLEHFDLEDMFGRKQKPLLDLIIEVKSHEGEDKSLFELHFALSNSGRAVAKYAGLFCTFNENIEITQVHRPLQSMTHLNNRPTVSFSDNVGVIHPNNVHAHAGHVTFRKKSPNEKIIGNVSIYCDGMMAKQKNFEI